MTALLPVVLALLAPAASAQQPPPGSAAAAESATHQGRRHRQAHRPRLGDPRFQRRPRPERRHHRRQQGHARGRYRARAAKWRSHRPRDEEAQRATADVYVVTTHYHPEHSLGASAFKGAKLVMTRIQQQDMTELGKQIQDTFAKRSALTAELLNGVPYPTPDILFDREYRLDLGGVHARLMWRGPAAHAHARRHDDLRRGGSRALHRRRRDESALSRRAAHVEHHDVAGDARRARGAEAGCASSRATARSGMRR